MEFSGLLWPHLMQSIKGRHGKIQLPSFDARSFVQVTSTTPSMMMNQMDASKGDPPSTTSSKSSCSIQAPQIWVFLVISTYGPKENGGNAAIKKRLYRVICSISWRLAYPKASVSHLKAIQLDHAPILLVSNLTEPFTHRPFRFEVAWIRDPGCYDIINNAWNQDSFGTDFTRLCQKQEAIRRNTKFFHLSTVIQRRKNSIDNIKNNNGDWISYAKLIKKYFHDRFKELFTE